jgi:hypothetical protein
MPAGPGIVPEALIREARRRHRQRLLAAAVTTGTAAVAGIAVLVGLTSGGGQQPPRHHSRPVERARTIARGPSGLALAGSATTLLMWPVGFPAFSAGNAPPAYRAELGDGRVSTKPLPGVAGGDFMPYLIGVGGRLVYVGGEGTMSIPADLTGRPRVLGSTPFFAPSAAAGQVWLVRFGNGGYGQGRITVRQVRVTGSQQGPAIPLPARANFVVRGTDAGFLLQVRRGRDSEGMVLWAPGSAPRGLPYFVTSTTAGIDLGFDATSRLVAYGTGCRWRITAANAPHVGGVGYVTCAMMRVVDVLTGRLFSFPAPRGTAGWVPGGFDRASAIAPSGQMIVAYAATRPLGEGRVRLYLMPLAGRGDRVVAIPSSSALFYAMTAWTAHGQWLLYQGRGEHLWAYQASSGMVRASSTPCCRYTGFVAASSRVR